MRFPVCIQSDSTSLFSVCHLPKKGIGAFPTAVLCHGLGGNKVGQFRFGVLLSEALEAAGIASVRFDFRGCGDSEGSFSEGSISGYVSDLHTVLNWTKSQQWCGSIGLSGRSFGGIVASVTASQRADIAALSLISTPYSFDSYFEEGFPSTVSFDSEKRIMVCQGEQMSPQFVDELYSTQMSAVMEKLETIPFLYIVGKEDAVVSLSHLDRYKKIRKGHSLFHLLPLGDHRLSRKEDRNFVIRECTEWFARYLAV